MDKKEIEKLIQQEKEAIERFQEFAKRHKLSKEIIQEQIDLYLDTLNKLYKLLEDINNLND